MVVKGAPPRHCGFVAGRRHTGLKRAQIKLRAELSRAGTGRRQQERARTINQHRTVETALQQAGVGSPEGMPATTSVICSREDVADKGSCSLGAEQSRAVWSGRARRVQPLPRQHAALPAHLRLVRQCRGSQRPGLVEIILQKEQCRDNPAVSMQRAAPHRRGSQGEGGGCPRPGRPCAARSPAPGRTCSAWRRRGGCRSGPSTVQTLHAGKERQGSRKIGSGNARAAARRRSPPLRKQPRAPFPPSGDSAGTLRHPPRLSHARARTCERARAWVWPATRRHPSHSPETHAPSSRIAMAARIMLAGGDEDSRESARLQTVRNEGESDRRPAPLRRCAVLCDPV